jgi:hypothetical protein
MKWTAIESTKAFHEASDKFHKAIEEIFSNYNSASIGDAFGGALHYVYVPPQSSEVEPALLEELKRIAEAINNQSIVDELMGEAIQIYRARLFKKIRSATEELRLEAMSPLYLAAGVTPKWSEVFYEHDDYRGIGGKETFVKKEIKSGVTVGRVVRQIGRGRPKEWTTAKLKSAVKKAAKAARPTLEPGEHLTLEHVTIELNKNRNDQKPLTVNAVKKLLGRYEVDWMDIRDAINNKALWHFTDNK